MFDIFLDCIFVEKFLGLIMLIEVIVVNNECFLLVDCLSELGLSKAFFYINILSF